jgi:hypothetical protein
VPLPVPLKIHVILVVFVSEYMSKIQFLQSSVEVILLDRFFRPWSRRERGSASSPDNLSLNL